MLQSRSLPCYLFAYVIIHLKETCFLPMTVFRSDKHLFVQKNQTYM